MASPNLRLRPYQERIARVCGECNTIVLLPTGSGKTLIAAHAILKIGVRELFLVPTIPLVAQQAAAMRSVSSMPPVGEYHGELGIPIGFSILVSTPKAFQMAQQRGVESFQWYCFDTLVFDEVHHVIKDHPYRHLAMSLRSSGKVPRVVGLTASLTYAVGRRGIEKNVQKLCDELRIEKIEHASDDELLHGGYLGARRGAVAEVRLPDVYATVGVVVAPEDRKPHLMHTTFFGRVSNGTATPFGLRLVARIRSMELEVGTVDTGFVSPIKSASLRSWGEYAHVRRGKSVIYGKLEHWYEALRLFVVSWEEAEDAAITFLRMMFQNKDLNPFLLSCPDTFSRFDNMCRVFHEKFSHSPTTFQGIIFVQQRVMSYIIQFYLMHS